MLRNKKRTQRDRHVHRLRTDGAMNEEENQGTTNKAKWRMRFIDTKQRLEGIYVQERKKGEK